MARFGFVGPTYQSESLDADAQRCVNFYPEVIESQDGASLMALYHTAGIQPYAPVAGTVARGSFQINGRMFYASDTLYEITDNGNNTGTAASVGLAIGDDGQPVSMAANSAGQLMVCSAGQLFLHSLTPFTSYPITTVEFANVPGLSDRIILGWTLPANPPAVGTTVYLSGFTAHPEFNGTTAQVIFINQYFVALTVPPTIVGTGYYGPTPETGTIATGPEGLTGQGLPPISQIVFLDEYFIALAKNSPIFYASPPNNGAGWDLSQVYQVSEFSDNVVGIFVHNRQLWVFGRHESIVYYDTGDPLVTFAPIDGAFMETGLVAQWSVAQVTDSLMWIGQDERGSCVGFRANGWSPVRISNHCIEREWQSYPTVSDAIAYTFQDRGHDFWHVYFPSADKSWRYDATTNMWHEPRWWVSADITWHAHRSRTHNNIFGKHLVGDNQSGNISWMDKSILTDTVSIGGVAVTTPIRRIRRAPHVATELERVYHHKMRLHVETGVSTADGQPLSGTLPWPFPDFYNRTIPEIVTMDDDLGNTWQFDIADNGVVYTHNFGQLGQPWPPIIFVDIAVLPMRRQFYKLVITDQGLYLTPAPLPVTQYIARLPMWTFSGTQQTAVSVQHGQVVIDPPLPVTRGALITLRWSNNGGHTWSFDHPKNIGKLGEFSKRVEWRGLGQARARVYEVDMSDPVPYRIIDAYLFATPGFDPIERYTKQIQKMA